MRQHSVEGMSSTLLTKLSKKPMQFSIHHVYHFAEVFHVPVKINFIGIDNEQLAFIVARNPIFVALVEAFEIIQTHVALVVAAARLYMRYQGGDARPEVDEQIGRLHLRGHGAKQIEVVIEVAGGHEAHVVQVGGKDVGVFKDGAILNDGALALQDFENLPVTAVEEVNLKIERPAMHVVVEIAEVGIVLGAFVMHLPAELPAQLCAKSGFAGANVSGNGDVLNLGMSRCFN